MFQSAASKLGSAASKVAGAAADTVSGTVSFAEHEAQKVGGTVAGAVSGGVSLAEHEAYKAGSTVANTVSGTISFSEHEAMKHITALTGLGSRSAAQQYVVKEFESIKETATGDVDVDVDVVPGTSDLKNVVLKVSPKNAPDADKNVILVSYGLGAAFSIDPKAAGDDSSNVAVMLELARGLSQQGGGLKNAVIFFFNTGEEEGLDGSHSFITQHPWSSTIRIAIDLEGMGIGGKPAVFQASGSKDPVIALFGEEGLNQLPLKQGVFCPDRYPAGSITAQDLFTSGVIQSATDFQESKHVGGLSGLDFAFPQGEGGTAVYHTKNDKSELLKAGSFQHLGENMLPFLLQAASSSDLPK